MAEQKKSGGEGQQTGHDKAGDAKADKALDQVQTVMDEETEQGFRGTEVDQTPNENYTVQGQLEGKPVPETEADPVSARREATNPDLR